MLINKHLNLLLEAFHVDCCKNGLNPVCFGKIKLKGSENAKLAALQPGKMCDQRQRLTGHVFIKGIDNE